MRLITKLAPSPPPISSATTRRTTSSYAPSPRSKPPSATSTG
ncbi:hypothetical protein ACFQVA_08810 [Actinomadura keratinilytica]